MPPAKDRDAHASGAVLALGFALAQYFAEASVAPTPICGAYRHIATEALHLVRRSRYQIEPTRDPRAARAASRSSAKAPDWLFDTWLLRVERALDLEAEHGALPRRHDRRACRTCSACCAATSASAGSCGSRTTSPPIRRSTSPPRCCSSARPARSRPAAPRSRGRSPPQNAPPPQAHLDVHWIAALANPTGVCAPWLSLARGLFAVEQAEGGFAAACRALTAATARERAPAIAELGRGVEGRRHRARRSTATPRSSRPRRRLRGSPRRRHPAPALGRRRASPATRSARRASRSRSAALGQGLEAIRVLAAHERTDAPRLVGRVLVDAGRYAEADHDPALRVAPVPLARGFGPALHDRRARRQRRRRRRGRRQARVALGATDPEVLDGARDRALSRSATSSSARRSRSS